MKILNEKEFNERPVGTLWCPVFPDGRLDFERLGVITSHNGIGMCGALYLNPFLEKGKPHWETIDEATYNFLSDTRFAVLSRNEIDKMISILEQCL